MNPEITALDFEMELANLFIVMGFGGLFLLCVAYWCKPDVQKLPSSGESPKS